MAHIDVKYKLTAKQIKAFKPLIAPVDTDLLYGGAKGGGKSYLLCVWAFLWSRTLIDILHVPISKNPLPVGFIGRKRGVDFTKTTLETWKKIIPQEGYYIREQDKEIVIEGRAKILFGGLDDRENINKFNSAELAFFAIDQAEETERSDIGVIEASIRLIYNKIQPPYKSLYTANPAECWLKEDFVKGKRAGAIFVPALPADNEHLPDNYIERLEKSFSYDQVLLQAYRDGNWEVMMSSYAVIPSKYMDELQGYNHHPEKDRFCVVCDPATGGDECVIYVFEHYKIRDMKILHTDDTMIIVGEMMIMGNQYGAEVFGVDVIGIGKGVYDRLVELIIKPIRAAEKGRAREADNFPFEGAIATKKVVDIHSSRTSSDPERWGNLRDEIWWKARELIIDHKVAYPQDEELRRQLCAVRYKTISSDGKVKLELKEDTKKRLGRSPDRADAYVYGLWTMQQVKSASKELYGRQKQSSYNSDYDVLNYK